MNFRIPILLLAFAGIHPTVAASVAKKDLPEPKVERAEKGEISPQVKGFIARCLEDDEQKYVNAHAWLKRQDIAQPDRDQMWEFLSGMVWNIDKPRARVLALEIRNQKKREEVLGHYQVLEQVAQNLKPDPISPARPIPKAVPEAK